MSLISELTEYVTPVLAKQNIDLYDIGFVNESGMRILRVMITKREGSIDLDTCSEVSEMISSKLDELDANESEYYLEVCSAGAERKLRSREEIINAIGSHIYVKLINPQAGIDELTGDLSAVEDDEVVVSYRVKTAKKTIRIKLDQISLIRLAVKL